MWKRDERPAMRQSVTVKSTPSSQHWPPKLTRQMLGPFLREHGYPIGDSTVEKVCAPAVGEGPEVACYWGNRALYEQATVLQWAESQLRMTPKKTAKVRAEEDRQRLP